MAQVKAIQQNANQIAGAIQGNLEMIANDLRGWLGDGDYGRIVNAQVGTPFQRANDLVQRVITQVRIDPGQYQLFYSVLEQYDDLHGVLKRLPEPEGESVLLLCMFVASQAKHKCNGVNHYYR